MSRTGPPPTRTDRTLSSVRVRFVRLWAGLSWTDVRFVQFVRGLLAITTVPCEVVQISGFGGSLRPGDLKVQGKSATIDGGLVITSAIPSEVRFRVDPGDMPSEKAARRRHLPMDRFTELLPRLLKRAQLTTSGISRPRSRDELNELMERRSSTSPTVVSSQ
jgi:hypothetical protein